MILARSASAAALAATCVGDARGAAPSTRSGMVRTATHALTPPEETMEARMSAMALNASSLLPPYPRGPASAAAWSRIAERKDATRSHSATSPVSASSSSRTESSVHLATADMSQRSASMDTDASSSDARGVPGGAASVPSPAPMTCSAGGVRRSASKSSTSTGPLTPPPSADDDRSL